MVPVDPDLLNGEAALAAIEDVRRRCAAVDGNDPLDEAAGLRLKHDGLSGTDHWVTADGFALRRGTELDLAVAPEARGQGLGGQLLESAAARPDGLTAWSHGDHPAAAALAARAGLVRARELWVMRRPSDVPLPEARPLPGVTIRTYGGPEDDAAVLRVNAAAFAHHPEQGSLDGSGLAERMREPWFDPSGLFLAVDDAGDLLGFHWTKRHDEVRGEVYVVAIAPTAQGRGLGRELTLAGVHHLVSRGAQEVILYVESDNAAALRVYRGLGFDHSAADTHVQYRGFQGADRPGTGSSAG
jgi:mycothiol synthase